MTQKYGNEWKRIKYQSLKNQGICVKCGKEKAEDGEVRCKACEDRHLIECQKDRLFYKSLGQCPRCKVNRIHGKQALCPDCADKAREYNKEYYKVNGEKKRQQHRDLYHQRKEAGICCSCGKNKAVSGRVRCAECLKKNTERTIKRRRKKKEMAIV